DREGGHALEDRLRIDRLQVVFSVAVALRLIAGPTARGLEVAMLGARGLVVHHDAPAGPDGEGPRTGAGAGGGAVVPDEGAIVDGGGPPPHGDAADPAGGVVGAAEHQRLFAAGDVVLPAEDRGVVAAGSVNGAPGDRGIGAAGGVVAAAADRAPFP